MKIFNKTNKSSNKNRIIFSVAFILVFLFFILLPSNIGLAIPSIQEMINSVYAAVLVFLTRTVMWVIVFCAGMFDAFMKGIWDQSGNLIDVGWGIVKDLMNMGFILVMLAISFATIFKIQAYSVKTLLPKLLIAILLINFSKQICYVIVDFAEIVMFSFSSSIQGHDLHITKSFLEWSTQTGYEGGKEDSEAMWDSFASRYVKPKEEIGLGMGLVYAIGLPQLDLSLAASRLDQNHEEGTPQRKYFTSNEFLIQLGVILLFVLYVAFIFLLLMILFVGRKISIWIYTIFSPYAFWTYTVPFLRKHLNQWWSKFGSMVFMGPVVMFYIYLAGRFMTESLETNLDPTTTDKHQLMEYFRRFPIGQLTGESLFITIVILAILTMALMTGKKMATAMAGVVSGIAGKAKAGVTKRLKKAGSVAWSGTAGRAYTGTKRTAWGLADKYTFTKDTRGGARRKAEKTKQAEEYQKVDEKRSSDVLAGELGQYKSHGLFNITRKQRSSTASLLNELTKRGDLDKGIVTDLKGKRTLAGFDIDTKEGVDKLMKFTDFIGADSKSIMNAMPELAVAGISKQNTSERINVIRENVKKFEGKKISKTSLEDSAVAASLSLNQIRDINKNGSVDQQEALVSGMGSAFKGVRKGEIKGENALQIERNAKNMALDDMRARGENTKKIQRDLDDHDVEFKDGKFVLKPKPKAEVKAKAKAQKPEPEQKDTKLKPEKKSSDQNVNNQSVETRPPE